MRCPQNQKLGAPKDTVNHEMKTRKCTSVNAKYWFMHKSSISSAEQRLREPSISETSDLELRNEAIRRMRLNRLEFADKIKHSAIQTEPPDGSFRIGIQTKDQWVQIDSDSEMLRKLQSEIREAYVQFDRDKARYSERERLLIAQMNALRDTQSDCSGSSLTILISFKGLNLERSRIPLEHRIITLETTILNADGTQQILPVTVSSDGKIEQSGILPPSLPLSIPVPHKTGLIKIHFRIIAASLNMAMFSTILGEWVSPPFVPCLKEKGSGENLRAILEGLGSMDIELAVV
jgi:hypothetical protein